MKKLIIIAAALLLAAGNTGCASVQQGIDAYGAAAVTGAQAANDTAIAANKIALCATPLSALVRHPEIVPAVRALCLPANGSGNVGQVLDAIPAAPK
jgi:hypothetical protein